MFSRLQFQTTKGWLWFKERAHGSHARAWLLFLSFSESSFLIIPPDFLLIPILLAGAQRWIYYAAITTIAAVAGAIFGYILGAFFLETIGIRLVEFYGIAEKVTAIGTLFNDNVFFVIFTAAFTPIPYKVFVLSAGFFKVNIFSFIIASILGRGLRYFAIAFLMKRYGEHITRLALRYFTLATFIAVALAAVIVASSFL